MRSVIVSIFFKSARLARLSILFGLVFAFAGAVGPAPAAPPLSSSHAADHVLIQFRFEPASAFVQRADDLDSLTAELKLPRGARLVPSPLTLHLLESARSEPERVHHLLRRPLRLQLAPGSTVSDTVQELRHHPLVDYCEPNALGHSSLVKPDDPFFPSQWYHLNTVSNGNVRADLHTPEAWEITRGSSNVIVGILDTGLNAGLAEFAGRVLPGYNAIDGSTNAMDDHLHGTAMTSIAAATGNNGLGIAGIDWNCRILPIKVLPRAGPGQALWYADGLDYARLRGCRVVNMSFGLEESWSETLYRAITNAIAAGIVVVALADNWPYPSFPGTLPEVITVGSVDRWDRWAVANSSPVMDVVAPGVDVPFLSLNGSLTTGTGNSASAPFVTGVASLLAAIRPDLTHELAQTLIQAGADDQIGDNRDVPGWDPYYGWGRLNAYNTLLLAGTKIHAARLVSSNSLAFEWRVPPNASQKRYFRVQQANSTGGPWTTLASSTNIVYADDIARWTSHPTTNFTAYYRVIVQVE